MWNRRGEETISEKPEEEDFESSVKCGETNREKNSPKQKNKVDKILEISKENRCDFNILDILKPSQKGKKKLLHQQKPNNFSPRNNDKITLSRSNSTMENTVQGKVFRSDSDKSIKIDQSEAKVSNVNIIN
jgi:hypothetical protein